MVQKILITTGAIIMLIGLLWPLIGKLPFGQLPGDIFINRPNFKFYFPFTTMILVSLIVSLILRLFRK